MTKSIRLLYPREEASWRNMVSRCCNPKSTGYEWYGGRGITVCDSWKDFYNFYNDMGPRPIGTSLDRIRSNEGYNSDNCRWATRREQRLNRKDVHLVHFKGKTQSLQEWAEELNIKQNTLTYRLKRGWSVERALTTNNEKAIAKERRNGEEE